MCTCPQFYLTLWRCGAILTSRTVRLFVKLLTFIFFATLKKFVCVCFAVAVTQSSHRECSEFACRLIGSSGIRVI